MFDLLTRDQLSKLHELLFFIGQGIFARLFIVDFSHESPADWYQSRVPTDSAEWAQLRTEQNANAELMERVYVEMRRRDAEATGAPANADGSDHERPMPMLVHDEGTSYCTSLPGKDAGARLLAELRARRGIDV